MLTKKQQKAFMHTICKWCDTLAQAERHQNSLYKRFDSVELVQFPRFSEAGQYIWKVR